MRTILTWYQSGGPFMIPLLLVGIAGLLLLVERTAFIMGRSRIDARGFIERVISLVRADKLDEALKLCTAHQSALPDLGLVILRSRTRDEVDLLNVAEASTLTVIPSLTRRLAWFPTLAILAVLVGVLGAVANLHDALASATNADANDRVASAVVYALRPFGAGVLTAIPLVAGHAYLTSMSQRVIEQLEEFAVRLVNALIDRPDVRLGHRD